MRKLAVRRIVHLGLLGLLALMLPLAVSAAPARRYGGFSVRKEVVPFIDLLAGASTNHPPRNRLYLARSPADVQRWSQWIGPEAAGDLATVDFRRYGLLAVFRLQQSTGMQISRIVRIAPTLALWLTVAASPRPPNPTLLTVGAFHVVEIEKPYLAGVKRLVVIAEAIGVWH
jgi:hypothetical protein